MVDKNYFLDQLRNGVDVNAMGQAMADMMNAAIADYNAEQEAERKAQAEKETVTKKHDAALAIVDAMKAYCDIAHPGVMDAMEIDENDVKTLIDALDQTFALMGAVSELKTALEGIEEKPATKNITPKKTKTDDEALAAFLATIM